MSRLGAACVCLLLYSSSGFAPAVPDHNTAVRLSAKADASRSGGAARFFGIVTASVVSFHATNALAAPANDPNLLHFSSSIQIADSVRIMDMSLPSYGDLKDAKASVANVEGLTLPDTPRAGSSYAASQKAAPSTSPMSSVLPSMGKSAKKEKAPRIDQPAEAKDIMPNVKTMDSSMPKYNF